MQYLAAGAAGLLLFVTVIQDAFEVMVLPRRVYRRVRLTRVYYRMSWALWSGAARRIKPGPDRIRLLGIFGATSLIGLFVVWASALILAFGLLEWAAARHAGPFAARLSEQLYMSGVTFFTLGYGDIVPHTGTARFISVLEAGCGIGFIALVISYLPLLHTLFSRREAHVIGLDARAGSPPSACTLLLRHAEGDGPERLKHLLRDWETWSADLLESHLSYPMLVYYRSQHDDQSWLAAIAAIMDCCALVLVGVEDISAVQARMTFTMGRQVLVEIARSFTVAPSRYSGGERLDAAGYATLMKRLRASGLSCCKEEDAEDMLRALRATYEPLLDALSQRLMLELPGWMAAAGAGDHWQGGPRGTVAARLIAELAERNSAFPDQPKPRGRLRIRLRRRRAAPS